MKDVSLYESFLAELRKKIPQGAKLTNTLVDMLYIEREAVYRRLRGEVPFTFMEVMTIAKELGISLDNLTETDTCKSRPFQLKLVEYANPLDADFRISSRYSLVRRMNRTGRPVSRRTLFPNLFAVIIPVSRVFIYLNGYINIATWIR